jgi:fatty acyl-CoA reductase
MIREALAGKRVMLTGVTGFLGTGLLERLLSETRVDRIDAVIRGDAPKRLSWTLAGSAFGPIRKRMGSDEFDALVGKVVRPISADLAAEPPPVDDDVDLIIHSAATVAFDPPIDESFQTNLIGTTRLYQAAGGRPFIHVSTAYVAGLTRGTQPEELLERDVNWRAEANAAIGMRSEVEDQSRRPEVLEKLEARARSEMSRAGPQSVAKRAEKLRREWVNKRLVRAGRARARSLGWPDVYTFTKALGEIALNELAGDNPLVIVRPSIIESALELPFPGWVEGFRMADPVILGFGRGALPEFPGIPDGELDLIPVDLVVSCVLAAAAKQSERRAVYHVCSGARNRLRFREAYELIREYFITNPLPERGGGTFRVPEWTFPGRRAVERRIVAAERFLDYSDRLVRRFPRGRLARNTARRLDRFRRQLDFAKRYADLYGPYAEVEVVYTDERAQRLYESLPEDERRDFPFDPASFTWSHYLQEVHLPMISAPFRFVAPPRPARTVQITPDGRGRTVLALFDVEGTLVASNVVEAYLWLRLAELNGTGRAKEVAALGARLPGLLAAERRDRGEFLRKLYRLYEGASTQGVRSLASEVMGELILRRLSPSAVRRIRAHRAAGHRLVFVTASLDFVVEPVAPLADEVIAAKLHSTDGVFTGDLERPPLVGEARASWLRDYARQHEADLRAAYAYADSLSDLPLLEAVGNPVAVNPDVALAAVARSRGWPTEEWEADRGTPKVLLPERVG